MRSNFPCEKWLPVLAAAIVLATAVCGVANGGQPDVGETLVVRLVHPDRQAAQVLRLFEGSRAPHPAAALAAWKNAARETGQLGKPLEAVIAFFNPEMASEWRLLHGAELIVNWEEANGTPRWYAIVPRDDGTVAAGVTASLLSDGAREAPLRFEGNEIAVTRFGRPGSLVAAHAGDGVIFGSARDELLTAVGRLTRAKEIAARATRPGAADEMAPCCVPTPLESGASFVLDASRLATMHSGPLPIRLAGELVRGLSCGSCARCRRSRGWMHWNRRNDAFPGGQRTAVTLMGPCGGDRTIMARVDALDRCHRGDIAGAPPEPRILGLGVRARGCSGKDRFGSCRAAPLRTRLNLLAAGAGASLEADLWPHLGGVTAAILGDARQPGRPDRRRARLPSRFR